MPPATPSAREVAHRLIARDAVASDVPDGAAVSARLACERICRDLSRWLGAAGCDALFARALADSRAVHPLLDRIRIGARSESGLEGVEEAVRADGAAAVAAALEAVLVAMIELLGRLIGSDMALRLLEQHTPTEARNGESPA